MTGKESLFQLRPLRLHAGAQSSWKIEADSLTQEDLECVAMLIGRTMTFGRVVGIPNGGLRLEKILHPFVQPVSDILIVDDVLTTGRSMEEMKEFLRRAEPNVPVMGAVVFARGLIPDWVTAVFQLGRVFQGVGVNNGLY